MRVACSVFILTFFLNPSFAYDRGDCVKSMNSLLVAMVPFNRQLDIYQSKASQISPKNSGYESLFTQAASTIITIHLLGIQNQAIGLSTTLTLMKNAKFTSSDNEKTKFLKSLDVQIENFVKSMDVGYMTGLVLGDEIKENNPEQFIYYQDLLNALRIFREQYKLCRG